MNKKSYNELLEELISNLESEIRINNETYMDSSTLTETEIKDSLVYVMDCSGITVSPHDLEIVE